MKRSLRMENGMLVAIDDLDGCEPAGEITINDLFPVLQALSGGLVCQRHLEALKDPAVAQRVALCIRARGHFMNPQEARFIDYFADQTLLAHEVISSWGLESMSFKSPSPWFSYFEIMKELYSQGRDPRLVYFHGFESNLLGDIVNGTVHLELLDKLGIIPILKDIVIRINQTRGDGRNYHPVQSGYRIIVMHNDISSKERSGYHPSWREQKEWTDNQPVLHNMRPFRPSVSMILEMWLSAILSGKAWRWFRPQEDRIGSMTWEHCEEIGDQDNPHTLLSFRIVWPNSMMPSVDVVEARKIAITPWSTMLAY